MKILAIVGSLQQRSSNKALVDLARRRAPGGVVLSVYPSLRELPHYDADLDTASPPAVVSEWRRELRAADAVLIASPEYGHGVPGSLKNALDWIVGSGELHDKPVAATCAAQGEGRGRLGLAMLLQTLRAVSARIVWSEPLVVPRPSIDEEGRIADPGVDAQVDAVLSALAAAIASESEVAR